MALADMCFDQLGNQNVLMLTYMLGVHRPGDVNSMLSATPGNVGVLRLRKTDAASLTATPISSLGDSALLLSGGAGGKAYADLIVWRGAEAFSIVGAGLPDARAA